MTKMLRGVTVLAATLIYLGYVFRILDRTFWTTGVGDWMDPYFINSLMEHWYRAVATFANPASPPMFYPTAGTLGYSHSLVLYAPFYVLLRLAFHPFQAYSLTLFAVIEVGLICLYLLCRRFLKLSFFESLVLCIFILSSHNAVNGTIGVWSQRASVFLIPSIALLGLTSRRRIGRPFGNGLAFVSGLTSALLFTHDFYTAQFAAFLLVLALAAVVHTEGYRFPARAIRTWWFAQGSAMKTAMAVALLSGLWAVSIAVYGGFEFELAGVRIRSHAARRPAAIAAASFVLMLALRRGPSIRASLTALSPWTRAFTTGVAAGLGIFLTVHVPAYLEHPAFPSSHVMNALVAWPPAGWQSPVELARAFVPYGSARSFVLVFVVAVLACLPVLRIDSRTRRYCWWFAAISLVVLLVPLRIGDFSIWTLFIGRIRGFNVIRDPTRIIYLYELAVVLAAGLLLRRFAGRPRYRTALIALFAAFIAADYNKERLDYERSRPVYSRWVEAPIAIDRRCRSFFVARASEMYTARSRDMWTLYGIDAMFTALNHSLPTLNGYSAWGPADWDLFNPHDDDYLERVRRWIERKGLVDVCRFDIEARTMTPFY